MVHLNLTGWHSRRWKLLDHVLLSVLVLFLIPLIGTTEQPVTSTSPAPSTPMATTETSTPPIIDQTVTPTPTVADGAKTTTSLTTAHSNSTTAVFYWMRINVTGEMSGYNHSQITAWLQDLFQQRLDECRPIVNATTSSSTVGSGLISDAVGSLVSTALQNSGQSAETEKRNSSLFQDLEVTCNKNMSSVTRNDTHYPVSCTKCMVLLQLSQPTNSCCIASVVNTGLTNSTLKGEVFGNQVKRVGQGLCNSSDAASSGGSSGGQTSSTTGPGKPTSSTTGPGKPTSSTTGPGKPTSSTTGPGEPTSSTTGPGEPTSSTTGSGEPTSSTTGSGGQTSSTTGSGEPTSSTTGPGKPTSSATGPGEPTSSTTGPGEPTSSTTGPGEPTSSTTGPGEPTSSTTGPGEPTSSTTGPGEPTSSTTGPGEPTSSTTGPGEPTSSTTGPGEPTSSTTGPGEPTSSTTGPGEPTSSTTGPGEPTSSTTGPGEPTSSTTGPGEPTSSTTGPGEPTSSTTGPGEPTSSTTGPGEPTSSTTGPGEPTSSTTGPGEPTSSTTGPGEPTSSTTGPGEPTSSTTGPGEPTSSTTGPGEPTSSTTGPGEPTSSTTGPGEPTSSTTGPGEPTSSTTGSGEPTSSTTSSTTGPGEPTSSTTGPGEPTSSTTGPGEPTSSTTGPGEPTSSTTSSTTGPGKPTSSTTGPGEPTSSTTGPGKPISSATGPGEPTSSTTGSGGQTSSTTGPGEPTSSTTGSGEPTSSTTGPGEPTSSTTGSGEPTSSTTGPGEPTSSTTGPGEPTSSTTGSGELTSSTTGPGKPTSSTTGSGGQTSSTTGPGKPTSSTTGPGKPTSSTTGVSTSPATASAHCMFPPNCSRNSTNYWMRVNVSVNENGSETNESMITGWFRTLFQQHLGECRSALNATSASAPSETGTTNSSILQDIMVTCDSKSSIRHTVCTVVLQLNQPTNLCCTECIVNTPRINSTLRAQVLQIQINEEKAEDLLDLSKNVSALSVTQIEKLVTQLYDLLSVSKINLDLGNKSINIVSNLLNTSVDMSDWTLNRTIIDIVDRVGLILELEPEKQNRTLIFPNVALAVLRVHGSAFKNTSFIINSFSSQINFVFISNKTVDGPVQSSIDLPSSLMDNIRNKSEASRIQFVYFQKSTLFQDRTLLTGERLIGGVLGCSVASLSLSSLTDNVTITFSNTEPPPGNVTVSCVFWDTSLNSGSGGWSSSGCTVVSSTTTETKCSCNHLTYFSWMECNGTNVTCPCGSPEQQADQLLAELNNASSLNASQVEEFVSRLEELLSRPNISQGLANTSVNIVSKLMSAPQEALKSSSRRIIIRIVDRVGLILELEPEKQDQTLIFPNVALAVLRVHGSDFKDTSFIINSFSSQINFVFISNETVDGPVQSSIDLPSSLMNNIRNKSEASRIQFVYFQKSTLFQDRTLVKGERLIGGVLGCSVANLSLSSLTDNVTITFSNTEPPPGNVTVSCVFWDTSLNSDSGRWSSSGCTVVSSTTTETKCSCNHLTYFSRMECNGTNVTCPCGSPEQQADQLLAELNNASSLNASQVEEFVSRLEELLSRPNISQGLANTSVNIVSKLMNAPQEALKSSSRRIIIRIVDRVGLILELEPEKQDQTLIFPNVALAVLRVNGSDFKDTSFIINSSSSQINFVFTSSETVDGPVQSSIDLPGSLMDNISNKSEASRIQFVYFQKSTLFQDETLLTGKRLIGGVLGCSVANLSLSSLTDNVTITFSNTEPPPGNVTVSCVFWDTSLNSDSGRWSSSGCTVVSSTTTETKCSCNHLTYFSRMTCGGTNGGYPNGFSEQQADQLLAGINDVSSLTASQVAKFVSQLEKLLSGPNISQGLANTSVNIVSKLMNAPQEALKSSSGRMVEIVEEKVGTKVVMQNETKVIQSASVVLTVMNMTSNLPQEMTPNSTEQGSIVLPALVFLQPGEEYRSVLTFYSKPALFQDRNLNPESGLVSGVLGLSVANMSTIINISNLDYNVTIRLGTTHVSATDSISCVFWNKTLHGGSGGWSSEGCMLLNRTANETVCGCNHLTSFGALLVKSPSSIVLTYITYFGCSLSAIFLFITLLTYLAFEKLHKDIPSRILIQFCLALLLLNVVFLLDLALAQKLSAADLCITTAFFLHYFLLATFTWMALQAFYMYLTIVKVFNTNFSRFMIKLGLAGWGIPLAVVITVLAVDKHSYGLVSYGKFEDGTTDYFCWFTKDPAFYASVMAYFCVTFLLTSGMFIVLMVLLCRMKSRSPQNTQQRTTMQDFKSVTALAVFLGLTWVFAFFAWGPLNQPFTYLFTICNSFQGFLVFVFYCAAKEKVRNQWRIHIFSRVRRLSERMPTVFSRIPSPRSKVHFTSQTSDSYTDRSGNDLKLHSRSEYPERPSTVENSRDTVTTDTRT